MCYYHHQTEDKGGAPSREWPSDKDLEKLGIERLGKDLEDLEMGKQAALLKAKNADLEKSHTKIKAKNANLEKSHTKIAEQEKQPVQSCESIEDRHEEIPHLNRNPKGEERNTSGRNPMWNHQKRARDCNLQHSPLQNRNAYGEVQVRSCQSADQLWGPRASVDIYSTPLCPVH